MVKCSNALLPKLHCLHNANAVAHNLSNARRYVQDDVTASKRVQLCGGFAEVPCYLSSLRALQMLALNDNGWLEDPRARHDDRQGVRVNHTHRMAEYDHIRWRESAIRGYTRVVELELHSRARTGIDASKAEQDRLGRVHRVAFGGAYQLLEEPTE